MDGKKYYWLRLKRDFFKRHDVRIVEGMPDGKEMILFYLKLMLEAVDHEGFLRFSEKKPYTVGMLATITNTDEPIVDKALDALIDLGMVELQDDGTFFIPETTDLIGFETEWAKQKRDWREQKRQEQDNNKTTSGQSQDNVYPLSDKRNSKSKELELEIEKEIDKREILKRKNEPLNAFGEFQNVLMTQSEIDSLTSQYGAEQVNIVLEELSGYIVQHPRKYKDHFLTLRNWLLRRRSEIGNKPIKANNRPNPYDVDDILNQAAAIEEREKGGNR